jgi:hypothetical protein
VKSIALAKKRRFTGCGRSDHSLGRSLNEEVPYAAAFDPNTFRLVADVGYWYNH